MKEDKKGHNKDNFSKNDSSFFVEEEEIAILKIVEKRNIDQNVKSPEKYISWYQYNMKNIDKYLTLCPHCKKPTLLAFNRAVIDSAIDYINGKRMFNQYSTSKKSAFLPIIFLFLIGSVFYFFLNYI
jgi:hypothetical protein